MRRPILPLPPDSIDRIAAGEVVERPGSVLKELMENALDAGAGEITLEISGGGIALLSLSDDGWGIPEDELPAALSRHATSKIRTAEDIANCGNLGFRGEALAAIASVSRLEICSRVEEADSAWCVSVRGGQVEAAKPAARPHGTTVTVRDLFANVPARRKFLKSEQAEKRHLLSIWKTCLLAWPEVSFRLIDEGDEKAFYPATADLIKRATRVLGGETARHLVNVEATDGEIRLAGLTSLPLVSRGNRTAQFVYLNRRPIQDARLSHAIAQAYHEVLPPGRFPTCVLFLEMSGDDVDVNVHPAKREVRFREARRMHSLFHRALREAVSSRGDLKKQLEENEELLIGAPRPATAPDTMAQFELPVSKASQATGFGISPPSSVGDRPPLDLRASEPPQADSPIADAEEQERLFWQLHSTFILTQIRGALVIIDQHNAHERVLYDRARDNLAGNPASVQQLLFPHTIELDAAEMEAWREHEDFFKGIGFEISEFGPGTLKVEGIPSTLQSWDGGTMIRDVLDDVLAEMGGPSEKREKALISFCCKSAIKAGEALGQEQMRHLVDQLFGTSMPYTCPHGRPIVIRIGMDELEKRFKRRISEAAD